MILSFRMVNHILITGATGYIGSHFAKKLVQEGYNITLLKRSTSNTKRIKSVIHKVNIYNLDKIDLREIFIKNNFDYVFNFVTDYGRKGSKLSELIETNVVFPIKLIDLASEARVKTYFNIDTSLNKKLNHYAYTKYIARKLIKEYQDRIQIKNLKLEYVYGPDDDESKFIPFAIKKLKNNEDLNMSPGEQEIDFVWEMLIRGV